MKGNATDGAPKVIAKEDIITTVTTERKAEEENAEQEDAQEVAAETDATTPLRHDTKVEICPPAITEAYTQSSCFFLFPVLFLYYFVDG